MEHQTSRSQKKRQAKEIEKLSRELAELAPSDLAKLPCDDFLRQEIRLVRQLKSGARKRQIKYIAKELRQQPVDKILSFLSENKGSKLQRNREIRSIEDLRDDLIAVAITEYNEFQEKPDYFVMERDVGILHHLTDLYPGLDIEALVRATENFAVTRNPKQAREIFRTIKAAAEQKKYSVQEAT